MYYHVTLKCNLQSILENGIIPAIGERSLEKGEKIPMVYLFPSQEHCEDALLGWLGDCFEDQDDDLIIFAINPAGLLVVDSGHFELTCCSAIAPSSIHKIYNESFCIIV
jgi:hypothetical protein